MSNNSTIHAFMTKRKRLLIRLLVWRKRNVADKNFMYILSIIVGLIVGFAAVIIKNSVHFIQELLHEGISDKYLEFLYFLLPIAGVFLATIFIKIVVKSKVQHGIPGVLYAISTKRGKINPHNMFSSIVTSAFTVGFGGSVGLEGPTVATGAAIGSNLGQLLRLNYKQIILLLGCACAGAMAAIFKAPVAAIVFALEVIMLNLSMASIVPLLLASSSATLTSYLFLGREVIYPVDKVDTFILSDTPSFILLGVLCGLLSVYFKRVYVFVEKRFDTIENGTIRLLIGGSMLGILIFFFPALYGEGYYEINMCIAGNSEYIYSNSLLKGWQGSFTITVFIFLSLIFLKVVATALTFGAGGIGGIFAPTLFTGATLGLFVAYLFSYFGINVSATNLVLLGMGGMIAGVLLAPLTAIFLIADLTSGYGLFLPLMLTASASYLSVRLFESTSVYTHQLARRKQLLTHHKDKAMLSMLDLKSLIETDFGTVHPDASLLDLIDVIKNTSRNIYAVVDEDGILHGIVKLDDVRKDMFDPRRYQKIFVRNIMYMPEYFVSPNEEMEEVVKKISKSGRYNFPVLDEGRYLGFVSRAKIFSAYRKMNEYFSDD